MSALFSSASQLSSDNPPFSLFLFSLVRPQRYRAEEPFTDVVNQEPAPEAGHGADALDLLEDRAVLANLYVH